MIMKMNQLSVRSLFLVGLSFVTVSNAAIANDGSHYRSSGEYYSSSTYSDGDGDYRDHDRRGARDDGRYDDRRQNRQCSKGTTGLLIGAAVGGLLGKAIVGRRGSRTTGMIVGAGAGALAGRAIEKSRNRRC
jgi:hypothetical protein